MPGTYIPVSGAVDPNGSLLALRGLVSDPTLLVPPTVTGAEFAAGNDSVQLRSASVSAELIASAGFPGLTVSGQSNVVYFVIDVMPTLDVPATTAGSPIATWVYGVGLRLGVRGISVKGNAALSYQGLAASATLNGSSTTFQFDGIGVTAAVMPLLKSLVDQSLTGFDVSTIQALGDLMSDLSAYLANPTNAADIVPQVVGVIFATSPAVQNAAATYGWALRGVQNGLSASALATKVPKLPAGVTLDPTVITNVYDELVGSQSATPTAAQKATAKQLTSSGP